ncbi:hypothetical protein BHM03_00054113 [Ensete ventricosum]|nr:hypothetical protein BHM03_00054113 [Ensete ventricosum]
MEEKAGKRQGIAIEEEEGKDVVLPGFRFHPTDEELIGFYLRRKVANKAFSIDIIKEIDIYKHDPWDLPSKLDSLASCVMSKNSLLFASYVAEVMSSAGEKESYFFCLRGRKYRNSIRPNRVTGSGFWKATGIDRSIHSAGHCIGLKKSLVYYTGSAGKGTKTDWMMHEFRLPCTITDNACPTMQEAVSSLPFPSLLLRNYSCCRRPSPTRSKPSSSVAGDLDDMPNLSEEYCLSQEKLQGWNSAAQPPVAPLYVDEGPTPYVTDFFRDGNWDELGRMVEFMTVQNMASCCE